MTTRRLAGFVATSVPSGVYGVVTLPESSLQEFADAILRPTIPHEEPAQVSPRIVAAEVRRTPTGSVGIWIECDVALRNYLESKELITNLPLAVLASAFDADPINNGKPLIHLDADVRHISSEDYERAVEILTSHFAVTIEHRDTANFSDLLPEAAAIIQITLATLQAIPLNLITSALYDALKSFLRPSKPEPQSHLLIRVVDSAHLSQTEYHVSTNDSEVLKEAMRTLPQAVSSNRYPQIAQFDADSGSWIKMDQRQS